MVHGRPEWFQASSYTAASTRLKYIATPAKLCSDDLLLICGRDKLLLSKVLPAPAHNRNMGEMVTRGLRPVDTKAGLLTSNKYWMQPPLSQRRQSVRVSGSLRTVFFALSQSGGQPLIPNASL